ncbi:MAG: winged-helix domain-containing protein [Emergencia sp.]
MTSRICKDDNLIFLCRSADARDLLEDRLQALLPGYEQRGIKVCLAGNLPRCGSAAVFSVDIPAAENETQDSPGFASDPEVMTILAAVHAISKSSQIASRNRIYWYLRDSGYQISEYRIRQLIPEMTRQGLISSRHGKYGLALTDKGILVLENEREKKMQPR